MMLFFAVPNILECTSIQTEKGRPGYFSSTSYALVIKWDGSFGLDNEFEPICHMIVIDIVKTVY